MSGPLSTTSPQWTTKCGRRSYMTFATFAVIFGFFCVSPMTANENAESGLTAVMNW